MKKFFYLLLWPMLFNGVLYAGHCTAIHDDTVIYNDAANNGSVTDKYIRSVIPGVLVGGGVGALSAFFDHVMPGLAPITWIVSYMERHALVDSISADMSNNRISHHKFLMEFCSFVATWVSYYKTYEHIHGTPPF